MFRNTITDQDQDLLLQGISLYNYQLADVKWINKIEEDVLNDNNKIKYQYTPVYGVLNNEFLLHNSNLFPNYFDINTYNTSVEFKYYGGNIISEVGLGKTLIMLSEGLCTKGINSIRKSFGIAHQSGFDLGQNATNGTEQ